MPRRLLPTLIPLPLLLLAATGAGAQQSYELRCRGKYGGSDLTFHQAQLTSTLVEMRFRASPNAAGTNGAGLEPGTCSWIDRPLNDAEPRKVWFEAPHDPVADTGDPTRAETAPSRSNIPLYLYDDGRYYSFWVYNTNRGFMRATAHRAWKDPIRSRLRDEIRVNPNIRAVPRDP